MKELFAFPRSLSGLSLALLFFVVPVFAQDLAAATKTDPVATDLSGTWQVKMALPTGEKPGESAGKIYTLEVEGADEVSIRSPGQGELEVTDALVSGGDLQIYFNYSPVKGGPGNSVELKGALDEKGNLAGTWQFLVTGQSGEWTAVGEGNAGRPAAGNVALVKAQKDTGAAADDEAAPAEVEEDEEPAAADEPVPAAGEADGAPAGLQEKIDQFFGDYVVGPLGKVLFWEVPFIKMPIVVAWLLFGAIVFTLRMKFVNFRLFRHAIDLVRGKYDDPDNEGEVSHFQALSTALSATVGLGNIAGVAIAVGTGGPGATFWIILVGLLGMTAKFTECTLGQKYRQVRSDGKIMGGAMYYLSDGLKELGLKPLGTVLAVLFCLLCIGGSFGGGNTFQVVQSLGMIKTVVPLLEDYPWVYGLIMTLLGGVVIIGGIRSIARVAEKIVPLMCGIYIVACLVILGSNFGDIPAAIVLIVDSAFTPAAGYGGFLGVLVIGLKRAVFSNEAGIGSAAIAHSAAKVKHPVEEGVVALLEPFIDTVVVCTMTALVIIITGAYDVGENPANQVLIDTNQGGALTSAAMGHPEKGIPWFPMILAVAVFLFAFSTMISWSYYGERCWAWMFGDGSSMVYRILFLVFTFLGSVITATNILEFSDLMILGMALPNILGVLLLSGKVKRDLDEYTGMLSRGELDPGYSGGGEEAAAAGEAGKEDGGSSEDEAPEA
ncbi:MAG: alanine/glycine:cation symporter family protein [Planctomycetota bacterium]|nr:alanine/glycine:cation symporter family protein [Planctomycetota bacterium]MEE3298272.1 alanine/glycine:cation symporter family protein [Planctomycetota bacterium]